MTFHLLIESIEGVGGVLWFIKKLVSLIANSWTVLLGLLTHLILICWSIKIHLRGSKKEISSMSHAIKPCYYMKQDGRLVDFNNVIGIIRNSWTNEIVSIVVTKNPRRDDKND